METLEADDLMALFGIVKNMKTSLKWVQVQIEAENSWLNGDNADANPYAKGTLKHEVWYKTWLECNKNC
jgi:hypothetical protein